MISSGCGCPKNSSIARRTSGVSVTGTAGLDMREGMTVMGIGPDTQLVLPTHSTLRVPSGEMLAVWPGPGLARSMSMFTQTLVALNLNEALSFSSALMTFGADVHPLITSASAAMRMSLVFMD